MLYLPAAKHNWPVTASYNYSAKPSQHELSVNGARLAGFFHQITTTNLTLPAARDSFIGLIKSLSMNISRE
jgi:hypothetical protein